MAWFRFLAIGIALATAPLSTDAWGSSALFAGVDHAVGSIPMNGDCSELPAESGDPQASADCCLVACAAALLVLSPTAEVVTSLALTLPRGIAAVFDGLVGEVATPPPRRV
jgi:hypothetical protein